jgi:hypothetical protein
MLYDFISKEITDKVIVDKLLIAHKKYPIYKDLEPTKIYDFNITIEINNTIQNAIQDLKEYLEGRKRELLDKKKRSEIGINIHSILHEELYNNIILEERIHMFENHLNTFISHHSKYFSRLIIKLKLMLGIVNEDFHLKKKKSLESKRQITSLFDFSSDTSSVSSSSSSSSTPKSTMNDIEEINVRLLIGDSESSKEIQSQLNTILEHIPQNDVSERRITKVFSDL